jgi:hypothetical protein
LSFSSECFTNFLSYAPLFVSFSYVFVVRPPYSHPSPSSISHSPFLVFFLWILH